jgi:hypothetical protein
VDGQAAVDQLGGEDPPEVVWRELGRDEDGMPDDQFAIYICDRFVVPQLSRYEVEALARGERLLDARTRQFIHDHFTYRVVITGSGSDARLLEAQVRSDGLPRSGRPTIDP